jgi:hypothetical protein
MAILRKLIREDLVLHPAIQERVDRFLATRMPGPAVGVHVRYSDQRSHLAATLRALDAILRREPELQVFLATDNPQVERLFAAGYHHVITAPHWLPQSGIAAHNNRACPDRVEHGIEALVDLYLLSRCRYLIIDTTSSFSVLAELLTQAPQSSIVDVKSAGFVHGKLDPALRRALWRAWRRLGLFTWGLTALRGPLRLRRALRRTPAPHGL